VSRSLSEYNATEWSVGEPLQKINNVAGWVLAGDCQLGANQPAITGSGDLCQIEFKAFEPGGSSVDLINDYNQNFQAFIVHPDISATLSATAPYPSYSDVYVLI